MANSDLRPMTIGEVLDRMFRLYKERFWLFAGIMSFPYLILLVMNTSIAWLSRNPRGLVHTGSGHPPDVTTVLVATFGIALLVLVVTFGVTGIGQAATTFAVSDLYLDRPISIRRAFGFLRGHILQLFGVIFVTGLIIGVGCIFLIVPGIILACRLGVSVPVAMLEDCGPGKAISRSMELTKGFAMQMFLIFVLTIALSIGVSIVLQVPFTILAATPRPHLLPLGLSMLQYAFTFIGQVLVGPIGAIAFCLMYYNLRVRKEGFDVEHLMASLDAGPAIGGSSAGPVPA